MANLEILGYTADEITKGIGTAAIAAYVLGYIVLSYHLSAFGFNPASPFRPRVLATGICALAFFIFPIAIGTATASLPGRGMPHRVSLIMKTTLLPCLCSVTSFWIGLVSEPYVFLSDKFAADKSNIKMRILIFAIAVAVAVIVLLTFLARWVWRNYHKRRKISIAVLGFFGTSFAWISGKPFESQLTIHMFWWLLLASVVTCIFIGKDRENLGQKEADDFAEEQRSLKKQIYELLAQIGSIPAPEDLKTLEKKEDQVIERNFETRLNAMLNKVDAEISAVESLASLITLKPFISTYVPVQLVSQAILVVAVYASWVFPFVPLKLGGGETIPATLYETQPGQPRKIIRAGILDQSDRGFLLLVPNHNKGLFIPKERVSAIYFSAESTNIDDLID